MLIENLQKYLILKVEIFPFKKKDYAKIEKQNNISISAFGY